MAHTALHFVIYCSLNIAHRCKGILVIDKGFIALWQLNDNNCDIPLNKLLKLFFPTLHQEKMPLAVVGSNVVIEVNGKKVRGRQYPWGVAEGRIQAGHLPERKDTF